VLPEVVVNGKEVERQAIVADGMLRSTVVALATNKQLGCPADPSLGSYGSYTGSSDEEACARLTPRRSMVSRVRRSAMEENTPGDSGEV
jgi:hypothetical protein